MKYGFGVDLGGTTVKIAYFDETGKMISNWEIPTVTANHGSQILPDIAASVNTRSAIKLRTPSCWAWASAFPGLWTARAW